MKSIYDNLIGIQPMGAPAGQIFNMKIQKNRPHQHSDFQYGGRLSNPAMTRKHFPLEKRETFLNYIKLVHPNKLPQLSLHYAIHVMDERWPEVEKYIREHPTYLHIYMKTFDLNLNDLKK